MFASLPRWLAHLYGAGVGLEFFVDKACLRRSMMIWKRSSRRFAMVFVTSMIISLMNRNSGEAQGNWEPRPTGRSAWAARMALVFMACMQF